MKKDERIDLWAAMEAGLVKPGTRLANIPDSADCQICAGPLPTDELRMTVTVVGSDYIEAALDEAQVCPSCGNLLPVTRFYRNVEFPFSVKTGAVSQGYARR